MTAIRALPCTAVAMLIVLTACAPRGGYYKDDGPPRRHPVDIHSIPDAVPRAEPLSKTGNSPYEALGKRFVPMNSAAGYRERGTASWYGKMFHGRRTSSGEKYDMYAMTAAHPTLPLPSYAKVTNLGNGKSVVVRVNDRGPFLRGRIIDLSYAAAYKLGIIGQGTGHVEVRALTDNAPRSASSGSRQAGHESPAGAARNDAARFYVQFGAFSRSANAQSLVRRLQEKGIGFAHVQQGNDGYFRVRSGPFSAATTAQRILSQGAVLGLSTTIVTE